jgi:integrase
MTSRNSFIYANQWGVWCFQRRFSKKWLSVHPWSPAMFRQSLGTKDKTLALKLARKIAVMLDELQSQFFETEEGFARALRLYTDYVKAAKNYPRFDDFQRNYLDLLDDATDPSEVDESGLIDKVQDYLRVKATAEGTYHEDIFIKNKVNTSGVESQLETIRLEIKDLNDSKKATRLDPITLIEAIDKFIEVKQANWKKEGDYESSLRQKYFPLLLEVVGNKTTDQLNKADVIKYRNAVLNLPVNRHKVIKYKNLTIDQIIAQKIPDTDQISKRTKSHYLSKVSGLLIWLESEGYFVHRIDSPLRGVIKFDKSAHEERDPYSDEELHQLFHSDAYLKGRHKFASFFWVPLIGLLSGARENEICQLELSDIKVHDSSGLWVFSLNQDDPNQTKKSVKKSHHKRLLPIHQILIDLGFLEFYELQMALGDRRLFPELPYKKGKGHIDKFQRWYNRTYKKHCHINNEKVSFHSFRHNVVNYLTHKLEVGEDRTFHFLGQKPIGGVQVVRYLKASELIMFANILNRMNFESIIDFSEILRWRDQPFAVKLFEQQATLKELQELMI